MWRRVSSGETEHNGYWTEFPEGLAPTPMCTIRSPTTCATSRTTRHGAKSRDQRARVLAKWSYARSRFQSNTKGRRPIYNSSWNAPRAMVNPSRRLRSSCAIGKRFERRLWQRLQDLVATVILDMTRSLNERPGGNSVLRYPP